ncbi:MAG: tetratricopeptide repeat protein [Bacteroidetes bacterium]|nr:tetratricopeptide repeat protein [Bacteroidota bacterium]
MKTIPGDNTNKRKILTFIAVYSVITLACTGVYFQTIFYDFTRHDDNIIIINNLAYLKDLSNLPDAILTDAWYRHKEIELYRPLQNVSFMMDAQWGGDIKFVTHLTNLILHILCCISIFHLLILLRFRKKYALAGALIYAVHYLFLHAVIWGPARGDLLLSLFSFLAMITFILLLQRGRWYYNVLHILTFALALFSKETAITLPVIFLFYLLLFNKKRLWDKNNLVLVASYVIIIIIFYSLRDLSIAKSQQAVGIGPLILNLRTIPEVIIKFFIPLNFSTMPSFDLLATLLGTLVMIGMTTFFVVKKKFFNNTILFSLLWFGLFLLPGIAYRPEFASYTYEYLDHRDYLPCFGLLMILLFPVQEIETGSRKAYFPKLILAFFIVIIAYLISMNFYLHPIYKNPFAYSQSAIQKNPRCSMAYFIHGNEIYNMGKKEEALSDFTNAVKYYPKFYDARYNKAALLFQKKMFPEALEDLNYLLEAKPDYNTQSYFMRGIIEFDLHDADASKRDFENVLKVDPGNQGAKQYLSNIEKIQSNISPALQLAAKFNEAGINEGQKGHYKEALDFFNKALAEAPDFDQAMVNAGNCKHALGDLEGACVDWKKAAAHGNKSARELIGQFCK